MGLIYQTTKGLQDGNRYVINEGGTRSGKTFAVLSVLISIACVNKVVISVVSETFPHLRKGAIRDFQNILQDWGLWNETQWSKSESTYNFPSGSIIEFFSVDSPGKVHGPARDILFINEAQNISYDIARHLFVRTTGTIFIDFNPTHEFWAHTELKKDDRCKWIHSTYRDNGYLTPEQVREIERNRHNAAWWTVYGEGQIGKLEGLVYPQYELIDTMPEGDGIFGLDFGYTNDPAAVVRCIVKGDNLYLHEEVYETGLLNSALVERLAGAGVRKNYDEIFADSAEPKSIDEIRSHGYNVKPADKGKDSILAGIQFINGFKIHVTKSSTNLIKELRSYTYVQDKDGKFTNKPIDDFNHLADSFRYAVFTKYRNRVKEQKIIVPLQRNYRNF